MSDERIIRTGVGSSAIQNVEELVEQGRVPIKMQRAEVGTTMEAILFYNIPPVGFTLGKNGCTGRVDVPACSVEYFDGDGKSLGQGTLVGVKVKEAATMDVQIADAREKFGY